MRMKYLAPSILVSLLLTACGGGGGGGGGDAPTAPAPVAVAITDASAKVVGASALEAVQGGGTSTQGALGAVGALGVQVEDASSTYSAPTVLWVVRAARSLSAGTASSGSVVTGASFDETRACPQGGTIRVQVTVADPNVLSAGDALSLIASNCTVSESGVTNTLNGSLELRFNSVNETASSLQANITFTANALSVAGGGTTITLSGAQTLDLNETTTSTTLAVSGTAVTTQIATSSGTHVTTWRNFSQNYTLSGDTMTASVSGTLESSSTKLGANGGSFVVSTPTPLSWSASTGVPTSGVMKVVGASNSQMLMTFAVSGVTIDVDANGDGAYEKTLTTTVSEMEALL